MTKTKLTNLTPSRIVHIIITLAIMIGFKYVVPASEPLTPLGVEVLGIFLGMLYGWLIAGDTFWPSMMGLIMLGLSEYGTVNSVLTSAFGNNTVLLLLFFYALITVIDDAGITEYVARWVVSRKIVYGRPWVLTLMIFIAMCLLTIMVSCAAATIVIFPFIKQIATLYDMKPGEKWTASTLIATVYVGCVFYMLLPFKSLPVVIFGNYEALSGNTIPVAPYILIVIIMTVASIICALGFLKFVVKPDVSKLSRKDIDFGELPILTKYQKFVLIYFAALIFFMLIPSFVPKTVPGIAVLKAMGNTGILLTALAVYLLLSPKGGVSATAMFSKKVGWSIIFIVASALTIAGAMSNESTGITNWIIQLLTPVVEGTGPVLFTLIVCAVGCFITNVSNNIATTAMLTPIIYSVGVSSGANIVSLLICMMFACNMGLCAPPASAPAAMIHGDKEWIPGNMGLVHGLAYSVINLILIFLISYPLGNLLF